MATTRKSIISTSDRVMAALDRFKTRLEGLKEVAEGENKDKAVTVAFERAVKAFESLNNHNNTLSEKVADFGAAEAGDKPANEKHPKDGSAPKKRGRKPKTEEVTEEKPAKKRGRKPKPKAKVEVEEAEEEKPTKKRGRKPKADSKPKAEAPIKKKKKVKAKVEDDFDEFSFDDDEAPKKVSKKDKAAAKSEKKKKKSRK